MSATFNDSKEKLVQRAQDATDREFGDGQWSIRQKVALTCRASFNADLNVLIPER